MEQKKVLILAGGASVVCTVIICVILILIWLFNQEEEDDTSTSSTSSKSPASGAGASPRSPRSGTGSRTGSGGGGSGGGEGEGEGEGDEEQNLGSSCIGLWSQPRSPCSATLKSIQTFTVTNGSECRDNSIGPTYGQIVRSDTERDVDVPACIQACQGRWSAWSGCPAGGSCNDETRTFTIDTPPGPGADCSSFGAQFSAGGAYRGATYTQTRACPRPAAGCTATCSNNRWVTQPCSVGCGDGTQQDVYQGTDGTQGNTVCIAAGGALFGATRPTPQPAGSGRAPGVCNLGACCTPDSFTQWRRNGALNCTPVRPEQQWVREPYMGRVIQQNCLLRTNIVTTGSAEGCGARLQSNSAARCVNTLFNYSIQNGCTPKPNILGTVTCSTDRQDISSCGGSGYSYELGDNNTMCYKKTRRAAACGCRYNCNPTESSSRWPSAITSVSCPSGWVPDTNTINQCRPSGTSIPIATDMVCDQDFMPDANSNRCIPRPISVDSTAPGPNECSVDPTGICPTGSSGRQANIRSLGGSGSGSGSGSNYIDITDIRNVQTQTITVEFTSSQEFLDAYVVINAEFPGSILSNATQRKHINISEGSGSFTASTHVSTWDMYLNKSITIYDSSGTTQLSDTITF